MRHWVAALAGLFVLATSATADDTMLVLDASGSMWGQIDGVTKIEIARDVMGDLLDALPAEERLGLVAYGHRREGDCGDIETIASVGAERETIRNAVGALKPKGKTPLSAAVTQAAEQMSYADRKATVVLVSDGVETCNLDPCEVGRTLERTGVDLTVHVIGFGLASPTEEAGLQCLAEETGGRFFLAQNAAELATALADTVTAPAEPEPAAGVAEVTLRATELEGGVEIASGLTWTIADKDGAEVFRSENAGVVETALAPGEYLFTATRLADHVTGSARLAVPAGVRRTITIALELDLAASVSAPEAAPAGSEVTIEWTGPARQGDYITVAPVGAADNVYTDWEYVQNADGPVAIRLPAEPGQFEVRYVLGRPERVLARQPIETTPVEATLDAPASGEAGASAPVSWTGPGEPGDFVTVVTPEAAASGYTAYFYTKGAQPTVDLRLPSDPGDYEVRYVFLNERVLTAIPITVTAAEATVSGPETADAGQSVEIAWTGPGEPGDFITVTLPEAGPTAYRDYVYTKDAANPITLAMPTEPGDFEIRYVLRNERVIARQPVTVGEAHASISAAISAEAGSMVEVTWEGPREPGDFVTITARDAGATAYTHYEYTKDATSPVRLVMPPEAGTYEIRYVLRNAAVIARHVIEATEPNATLEAPDQGPADAMIEVAWTGPAGRDDFVTVVKPSEGERAYRSYAYTRDGSPAHIRLPTEPGGYELRYVLAGKKVIATRPVRVNAP